MVDDVADKPWEPPKELMDRFVAEVKAAPDNLWQRWHDHEADIAVDQSIIPTGQNILNKIAPQLNTIQNMTVMIKLRGVIFYTSRNIPFPENF